jgi:hypothetical protein
VCRERLAEASRRQPERHHAHDGETRHLRPENVRTDALEKHAPHDHEEVAERVEIREPLHDGRHVGDRKHEPGQQDRREVEEEAAHHRLLLRLADRRDEEPDAEGRQQIQDRGAEEHQQAAADRDSRTSPRRWS